MLKAGATNERPARHKTAIPAYGYDADGEVMPLTDALIVENYPADPPAWLDGVAVGYIQTAAAVGEYVNIETGQITTPPPEPPEDDTPPQG